MPLLAITVLGHDRPGIIAETTGVLAELGLNIEDSTMTLLRGHFAMMLITDGSADADDVEEALGGLTTDGSLSVAVREVPPEDVVSRGSAYLLSVHGGDRPGIVSTLVSRCWGSTSGWEAVRAPSRAPLKASWVLMVQRLGSNAMAPL